MNTINQVIIEGVTERNPEIVEKDGEKVTTLSISYVYHYRNVAGEETQEVSIFDIEAYGDALADFLSTKVSKGGKRVRCIGRLRQVTGKSPKVVIVAEHMSVL